VKDLTERAREFLDHKGCASRDEFCREELNLAAFAKSVADDAVKEILSVCLCWKSENCPLHSVGIAEEMAAHNKTKDQLAMAFRVVESHKEREANAVRIGCANITRAEKAESLLATSRWEAGRLREALQITRAWFCGPWVKPARTLGQVVEIIDAALSATPPAVEPTKPCEKCHGTLTVNAEWVSGATLLPCPKCAPAKAEPAKEKA